MQIHKTPPAYLSSRPHAVLHHRNQRLSCVCSYSLFRDLAVPHFRPVPFRTLDRSSVPFRSAPFREIVTTKNKQFGDLDPRLGADMGIGN